MLRMRLLRWFTKPCFGSSLPACGSLRVDRDLCIFWVQTPSKSELDCTFNDFLGKQTRASTKRGCLGHNFQGWLWTLEGQCTTRIRCHWWTWSSRTDGPCNGTFQPKMKNFSSRCFFFNIFTQSQLLSWNICPKMYFLCAFQYGLAASNKLKLFCSLLFVWQSKTNWIFVILVTLLHSGCVVSSVVLQRHPFMSGTRYIFLLTVLKQTALGDLETDS